MTPLDRGEVVVQATVVTVRVRGDERALRLLVQTLVPQVGVIGIGVNHCSSFEAISRSALLRPTDTLSRMDWDWHLALTAVVAAGSLVGWWDNRRRIREAEIGFKIERPDSGRPERFLLRNTGKRTVYHVLIDPSSVERYALTWNVAGFSLEPEEGDRFDLMPDPHLGHPDSLRILYKTAVGRRPKMRVVRLPSASDAAPSPSTEEP